MKRKSAQMKPIMVQIQFHRLSPRRHHHNHHGQHDQHDHRRGQKRSSSHLGSSSFPAWSPRATIAIILLLPLHRNNFSCKLDLFSFFALRMKCRKCSRSPLTFNHLFSAVVFPTFDKLSTARKPF